MQVLSKDLVGFVAYVEISAERSTQHGESLDIHIVSLELRGERLRIMVIGETRELRRLLQRMTEDGMVYRVTDVSDARFEPDSPLSALTDRQRKIMLAAFRAGYYDVPRMIDSQELAVSLNLDKSTVVEHLRKAERRLLVHMIGKGES